MKIKKSELILWKKRILFSLASIAIFFVFYGYFVTNFFTITNYKIVGVPAQYENTVVSEITSNLNQKIFGFIPKNKIFSYHGDSIKHAVIAVLPNTETIKITPFGLHTVKIVVTKYTPIFKIDDYHGVTEDGILYQDYDNLNKLPSLAFASSSLIAVDEKNNPAIKKIDPKDFPLIVSLLGKVDILIFKVSSIYINEDRDIAFFNETGKSKILFSGLTDNEKVWSNLVSAIDTNPLKDQLLNKKDNLEYLDARFGNKVFFKFTNGEKTDIIENNATSTTATIVSE